MEEEKLTLNQLMILSLFSDHRTKTGEIAEELSMTKQGVLYHVKVLKKKGLIDEDDNITNRGFEILYSGLTDLRKYLSESLGKLETALTWEAIADVPVSKGDRVFLSMKKGYLHAGKKQGRTATGIAVNKAYVSDLLLVENVSGTVNMSIGNVTFYVIKGTTNSSEPDKILPAAGMIGIIGEGASVFCRNNGIKPDMEFGSIEGAFEACTRGLDAQVFVTDRRFRFTLQKIVELSKTHPRVSYRIEYL